jgi:glycosyltransferase involved in cell wall biosynthesis
MRISFNTPEGRSSQEIKGYNGYGYATLCILSSLSDLGYEVNDNDPTADVEFVFNQPQFWEFRSDTSYKIGYHPWESTELLEGWPEIMNQCDEIWTPSPVTARWYKEYSGITVPVHVYEHGVEHDWEPIKRDPNGLIKFLHVGGEATRKGGWDMPAMFRVAFNGYREDVSLTLKMINTNWNGIDRLGKVSYINERYNHEQMKELFRNHDIYAYPSHGEGFGLTPLQALATGMPTIMPDAWAPYKRFLDPKLTVSSAFKNSNWPEIHPGKMFSPDRDEFVDRMRYAADNYDEVRDFACSNAFEIHKEYDWNTLTKEAFEALEARLAVR